MEFDNLIDFIATVYEASEIVTELQTSIRTPIKLIVPWTTKQAFADWYGPNIFHYSPTHYRCYTYLNNSSCDLDSAL